MWLITAFLTYAVLCLLSESPRYFHARENASFAITSATTLSVTSSLTYEPSDDTLVCFHTVTSSVLPSEPFRTIPLEPKNVQVSQPDSYPAILENDSVPSELSEYFLYIPHFHGLFIMLSPCTTSMDSLKDDMSLAIAYAGSSEHLRIQVCVSGMTESMDTFAPLNDLPNAASTSIAALPPAEPFREYSNPSIPTVAGS